jgi:tRNA 2-thiouridine synthesizing protein A
MTPRKGRLSMTTTLDTKGMNCPLPILKAKKAIKGLAAGETLQVLSTDPGSVKDFEAFCRSTGNELMYTSEADGVVSYMIKKSLT